MTGTKHHYQVDVDWTGNLGTGTQSYRGYARDHDVRIAGKPTLAGSADATFRGDASRHNPEDLLVAALSACHLMSYLHAAAMAGVVVTAYTDAAEGVMEQEGEGGHFVEVVLHPRVTVTRAEDVARADELHAAAHHACFIANSVNFPVRCEPRTVVADL
jgi:organic hydroperoxide reductase OsmC/OhrA